MRGLIINRRPATMATIGQALVMVGRAVCVVGREEVHYWDEMKLQNSDKLPKMMGALLHNFLLCTQI